MSPALTEQLANIPLIRDLPADEQARLAQQVQMVELAAGQVLFEEGDASGDFYVVLDGQMEILKPAAAPEDAVVDVSGRGEILGEMGLFKRGHRRMATVKATVPSHLLRVPFGEFDDLAVYAPVFGCRLAGMLSERLTSAHETAVKRLVEKNCRLQHAYEQLQNAQEELLEKRALEQELKLAREIQLSILPAQFPALHGYDFGAAMLPARAVGGDFYSLFPLDDRHMGFVVGDVMGKGIPAAIYMAQTHALLRALAHPASTPCETLRQVNRLLLEMGSGEVFTTLIYGILAADTGECHYARAGHELPMLINAHGQVRHLPMAEGMPLGILDQPVLEEASIRLSPGELLFLYTDGVTDAGNEEGGMFEWECLTQALSSAAGHSATEVAEAVLEALRSFQGEGAQADDITLVAIRRQPAA
jgi:serine phosphatase RsbU (regulator of sigma subunit)